MASDFTRAQLDARKEYIKSAFENKKEYFYYRDLRKLILNILDSKHKEFLDFQVGKFLGVYRNLVEKTKQEHSKNPWDDVECRLGVYVMEAMRDTPEFQQAYKSLQDLLLKRIETCHKKKKPAEEIMTEEEIMFVLFEKPGLISRCAKPSWALQNMACEKSPRVIQFIDEPDEDVVNTVVRRDVKNILLVKPEFRTLSTEIDALNAGVLRLNQITSAHKKRLVEYDYKYSIYLPESDKKKLVHTIETQSASLTPAQLETFRLTAVGWDFDNMIKYMRNPSKAVKEKAVCTRPENIEHIKFQYPAIQDVALFSAFAKVCRDEWWKGKTDGVLNSIYGQLRNPSVATTQIYKDLKDLYHNFPNIKNLKYQNSLVQKGLLDMAATRKIDVRKVLPWFQNPSKDILDTYAWILKQQLEQGIVQIYEQKFEKTL